MRLSIMQPAYLPWIGYFQRVALSELHVVLDHVQIDKNSKTKFANRNRIRTPEGATWLTVPLKTKDRSGDLAINRIEIDNTQAWALKHQRAIQHSYARAPFARELSPRLLAAYDKPRELLIDLINETTSAIYEGLAFQPDVKFSSDMQLTEQGSDLILEICRRVGATEYISGPFGRDYLDRDAFARANVRLLFHEFTPIPYPQAYPGFEPYLSMIDLLFNCGPECAANLRDGAKLLDS